MYLMIRIYMIVCVVLLLFDILFLIVKGIRNHRLYPRNTKFEHAIKREIKKYKKRGGFSDAFKNSLHKMLKKTQNLITLCDAIEKRPDMSHVFLDYIFAVIEEYRKKSDYEQAYYTYVISALNYTKKRMPAEYASELIGFLDSKSIYTFINTLNAFYHFGNVDIMFAAVEKINERGNFYHKKLLVDGLLSAQVDHKELGKRLKERFPFYSVHMQESLVDYFRMSGLEASELCLKIARNPETYSELRYGSMRYFVKYPNEKARKFFLEILKKEEDWVAEMIAIQALSNYEDAEVREIIKSKITSKNWHIRNNALKYIRKIIRNKDEIYEIISRRDKYTSEALLYQYADDEEMSQYISETMHQLEETDNAERQQEVTLQEVAATEGGAV